MTPYTTTSDKNPDTQDGISLPPKIPIPWMKSISRLLTSITYFTAERPTFVLTDGGKLFKIRIPLPENRPTYPTVLTSY